MHEVAERLQAAGRHVALLIFMEQSLVRPFDGPVVLLYGRNSHLNPFNQPGVEAYKRNMFALLEKPGYEAETKAIKERL